MKSFKEMIEDAPVNATGDAVATNEPIVRKKKKKEDASGREIGTPELLKRYVDDTPGQSLSENAKLKKILSKVKGLTKQQLQVLSTMNTTQISVIVNQLSSLVMGDDEHPPHVKDKEKEKKKVVLKGSFKSVQESKLLTQGKLVTSIDQVFDIITKKLKSEMGKKYKRNRDDGLQFINRLAKMVGMTASDKGQMKNKMFLRMGEELEEGLWDNIRAKRARGEKMRKKGEKGAPTQDQIKRAQEECCAECLGHYDHVITESEYQGKKVKLNDPIRTSENPNKKFKVYVKNEKGKVVVVRFGDPKMGINRDNPERRKSFRARHNCADPGPKWKARYWSCYQWRASAKVDN
tara:strand:- start:360 stop:1403 length:1044 start_codon:yes stop_codon:yes gene_type:complete